MHNGGYVSSRARHDKTRSYPAAKSFKLLVLNEGTFADHSGGRRGAEREDCDHNWSDALIAYLVH